MASTQTLLLRREAAPVQAAMERLRQQRVLERLWAKDPSLWSADATVQASIRQRLGWLTIPRVMAAQVPALRQCASEIRQVGFTQVLLLGMGGSGLFAEVCRGTFGAAQGHPDVVVLDTTDPTAILAHQRRCPLERLLVIVSSKSGSTIEVAALSKYFYEAFRSVDAQPGTHCLLITDQGSPLAAEASARHFRRVFVHGPESGADVGGRFSALTYFGLVPASLLGVDTGRLLERAQEMLERCSPNRTLTDHPAIQLGAVLGALALQGMTHMTLLCSPALASFGTWVEQLVAESTGKAGKGIVPLCGEELRDAAAYGSDRFFIELQLASEPDRRLDALVCALAEAGRPVVRVRWEDRYDLGGEVIKWSMATTVAGSLLGIDPFDEPNVRESKDRTTALLGQYAREQSFPTQEPWLVDGDVALYGAAGSGESARTLSQGLSGFLQQARPHDYMAILSFLPRTDRLDAAVHAMRQRIAATSGRATMAQFGPRYLHSTGQLYKGGADTGLFVLLTAEDSVDLPIPGELFGFRVLKDAQALGDFQAMRQKGRRILRVHLRGNLEQAAQRLLSALDDATATVMRR